MSIFIKIEVDSVPAEVQQNILRLCPVNIFAISDGKLVVNTENEDECTLCELCLRAAPPDVIRIRKLYKDEVLVSTGG